MQGEEVRNLVGRGNPLGSDEVWVKVKPYGYINFEEEPHIESPVLRACLRFPKTPHEPLKTSNGSSKVTPSLEPDWLLKAWKSNYSFMVTSSLGTGLLAALSLVPDGLHRPPKAALTLSLALKSRRLRANWCWIPILGTGRRAPSNRPSGPIYKVWPYGLKKLWEA